jgi:NADPH:quinone reductase-like Zn-dependent oxidoreductase
MRAAVIQEYGPPDVLHVGEVALRRPGSGEVELHVEAAAVNPTDAKVRRGELTTYVTRPLPIVLGWDACGVVGSTGEGIDDWHPGDRVVAMWDQHFVDAGSYAEAVVLPAESLAPAPETVDAQVAAALPISALTAAQALDRLALPPGARLLVTGAAGAVGGFAIQLARHRGLEVVASVRSASDSETVDALGADRVVRADEPVEAPFADAVLHAAGPVEAIDAVRDGGGYVSVVPGGAPAPERGIEPEVLYVEANGPQLAGLARLVDDRVLTPRVVEVLPLSGAAEAHRRLEAGGLRGRLVLDPSA